MREIKFKFWDTKEKRWCSDSGKPATILDYAFAYGMNWDHVPWVDIENGRIVTCQFTGLQDKNGKDIYESDLIQIPDPEDKASAEVVFENAAWRKKYKTWGSTLDKPIIDALDITLYEIIGNRFEHPELLEGE